MISLHLVFRNALLMAILLQSLTLMVWNLENPSGMGSIPRNSSPFLFSLLEGQLEQNLMQFKYVPNCLQNRRKIGDVTIGFSNYVIFCLRD